MDFKAMAQELLQDIGGIDNVENLTHCATRLRFNLVDDKAADTEKIKKTPGVLGVTVSGGQYQVIIGNDVEKAYNEVMPLLNLQDTKQTSAAGPEKPQNWAAKLLDVITSVFTPVLPAITASGMLKAVLSLLVVLKWLSPQSQAYQIVNLMADAAFYFLPMLLAISSAKKFKTNTYLAAMVGGILLHPSFIQMVTTATTKGGGIHFGLIPIYPASYASTVIPIILTVWIMSYIERFAKKISPKMLSFFLIPLITVFITGILALTVLGPLGFVLGNGIASLVKLLESYVGWLLPMILGAVFPLLVMTGTHYGLVPIGANNIMSMGYDTIIGPGNLASNIAQGGSALAVGFKTKNTELKQLAFSSGFTAVCGITEPALFGINLRFKRALYAAMLGGGFGGLYVGLMGVKRFATGSPGLLTLPVYIGGKGLTNITNAIIGCAIAFVVAFIASYLLYQDDPAENAAAAQEIKNADNQAPTVTSVPTTIASDPETIFAPVTGELIPLSDVDDDTFAEEIIGKGVAILPTANQFYAPVNGEISMLFKTKHAIGIKTENGHELLIHIGLDTVKLDGQYFTAHVKIGDQVKVGDLMMEVDLAAVAQVGYSLQTPIIITNLQADEEIKPIDFAQVTAKQEIYQIVKEGGTNELS